MRRNPDLLFEALNSAKNASQKARAHYQLAVFHDNNSRESEAIPHYRAAIRCGLDGELDAMARAWLASSLYKTGVLREAARECERVLKTTHEPKLRKFLKGLRMRIQKRTR